MAYAIEQDNYRSKRSYVSTTAFNGSIYSYVTALNPSTFKQEGKLVAITTSPAGVTLTAVNCPAGRILRENGRKLYPGVNVGLLSGDTYQGAANFQGATEAANHFWVGVFDAVTGVKGFINPNASTFSIYNTDKSLEVVDINETNGAGVTGGRFPLKTVSPASSTGVADLTLTAAQTVNGIVVHAPGTSTRVVTLPSTAAILAAMGATIGATAEFVYVNTGSQTATVTALTGTTFVNTTSSSTSSVLTATSVRFILTVDTATTVIIYRA